MPPEAAPESWVLRPATRKDLPAVGEVLTRTRAAAYPAMPHGVHADADVRAWVADWSLETHEVWLAADGEVLLGYARFTPTWLEDLYVDPTAQRGGVGSALLDLVKARHPEGFSLWVFESNRPARDFYLRHGLIEAEHTDGAENEERAPDLRMVWDPRPDPGGAR